jgi:hypothetical protein
VSETAALRELVAKLLLEVVAAYRRWELPPGWLRQLVRELDDAIPAVERRLMIDALHELHAASLAQHDRLHDLEMAERRRDRRQNKGTKPQDTATQAYNRFGVALLNRGAPEDLLQAALRDVYDAAGIDNPREPARKRMREIRALRASQKA